MKCKKHVIIGCLLFSTAINAHVSRHDAIKLFRSLIKIAKVKNVPRLMFSEEKDFNGWATVQGITITQGMLDFTNKAELAGVMGHEITHWVNRDPYKVSSSYTIELRADKGGLYYAEQLGYHKCAILHYMIKARRVDGEDEGDGIHPGWTIRLNALGGGNCQ